MRPLPVPDRSARRKSAPLIHWISFTVSPSPRPLSGSFEVAEQVTAGLGSQTSIELLLMLTATSLWFGGQSEAGDGARVSTGALVSTMVTLVLQPDLFPLPSVALHATWVVPRMNGPAPHEAVQVPQLSWQVAV